MKTKRSAAKSATARQNAQSVADWADIYEQLCSLSDPTANDGTTGNLNIVHYTNADGHLLVAKLDDEPVCVALLALGPLDEAGLQSYLTSRVADFTHVDTTDDLGDDLPWCAIGTLPAGALLDEAEHAEIHEHLDTLLLGLVVQQQQTVSNN